MTQAAVLYLDLLKKCLTNWIYGDLEEATVPAEGLLSAEVRQACATHGIRLMKRKPFAPQQRLEGRDWPATAHTMIGCLRLDNLQFCVEDVLANNIPGDLMETGVWRGGSCIFMRAVLKVHDIQDRCVWVADSFAGLPAPNPTQYPHDAQDQLHAIPYLAVSLASVQANFERYGLLDSQVRFLPGWFRDTLPQAPVERLAVLRLDGDLYESTMDALVHLYPKLSAGGYLIVDDYGAVPACRQAVTDYRERHGIREEMHRIDWGGVWWRRG